MAARVGRAFAVAAVLLQGAAADQVSEERALAVDDECHAGGCALSALQLRGERIRAQEDVIPGDELQAYGAEELRYKAMGRAGVQPPSSNASLLSLATEVVAKPAPGCFRAANEMKYSLGWKAQGTDFFKDWTFMTIDETHGAADYVSKDEALKSGLAKADPYHATIRASGSAWAGKRKSVNMHTNYAWDPKDGFLTVMKYRHVPFGCGVWPGFWTMHSSQVWPAGGELDILEYANAEVNKASFHINGNCRLDTAKLGCMNSLGGVGGPGPVDCDTDYWKNKLGCRPQQKQMTGAWWANNPGIVAAEWTQEHVKVFYFPEGEIPDDLKSDSPNPETWDKYIVSYFPFTGRCSFAPQELVLNIQMCGDWAGSAWARGSCPATTGFSTGTRGCRSDIFNAPIDCCSQYVTSSSADSSIKSNAFFDIDFVKVFSGSVQLGAAKHVSGTFKRGGQPMK